MWIPLKNYCEQYPWPKDVQTLRVLIWEAEQVMDKGLPFVNRFGKRVLIDGEIFQAWLSSKEAFDVKQKCIEMARAKRENKKKSKETI